VRSVIETPVTSTQPRPKPRTRPSSRASKKRSWTARPAIASLRSGPVSVRRDSPRRHGGHGDFWVSASPLPLCCT